MTGPVSGPIAWHVGQRVVINRQTITTINRITPAGRVVVALGRTFNADVSSGRTFNADGSERVPDSYYNRAKLEPLTPEIAAEMALIIRGRKASSAAYKAVDDAGKWLQSTFSGWRPSIPSTPDPNDVDRAENLAAAILQVMNGAKT